MRKIVLLLALSVSLSLATIVKAQPGVIETEIRQLELQGSDQATYPTQAEIKTQDSDNTNLYTQEQTTDEPPVSQSPVNPSSTLTDQTATLGLDSNFNHWLAWWWRIGFWSGILWIFLWVFVGWQWTKFKFWGFAWPWPWWFWIPIFWFIPWLIVAWNWWLAWWGWWIWIWWAFPWVFWLFWWLIIFKEVILWVWKKDKG